MPFVYVSCYDTFGNLAHQPSGTPTNTSMHIYTLDENTGKLQPCGTNTDARNPAFIRFHPTKPILYTCSESIVADDLLYPFKIDEEMGSLSLIREPVSLKGKSACYLTLDAQGENMMFINYWDSTLGSLALSPDGTPQEVSLIHEVADRKVVARHRGDHLHERQSESHVHSLVLDRTGRMAFVPDLGKDVLHQFVRTKEGFVACGTTLVADPNFKGPYGPRYLQFHDTADLAFVVNELSSTVAVYRLDSQLLGEIAESGGETKKSVLTLLKSYSTIPADCKVRNTCGRICVSPDGHYVVVSNRGHDSLTVHRIKDLDGTLEFVQTVSSGGKTPRHFKFTPCGKWCISANQDSDNITVFSFDKATGKLTPRQTMPINSPNFVGVLGENLGTKRLYKPSQASVGGGLSVPNRSR